MSEQKPKEWRIVQTKEGHDWAYKPGVLEKLMKGKTYSATDVIDKRAYDALKQKLDEITKDHENDWKRIQDAERKLDEAMAEIERYEQILRTLVNSYGDYQGLAALERIVKEARQALEDGK